MALTHCRVILVRPRIASNIGAVARSMRNFGLTELLLVAPETEPWTEEARRLATHGEEILIRARIYSTLREAAADCRFLVATSSRAGSGVRRQSVGPPHKIIPRLAAFLPYGPAALIFGPERNGLRDEEISCCHYLIHVPADPTYPVLNVAQAVTICLYELYRACQSINTSAPAPPAKFTDQERAFSQLRAALEEIHFLYDPKADSLMHGLRHLLSRAGPTDMEIKLLHGLARQIRWFVQHCKEETRGHDNHDLSRIVP